MIAPDPLPFQPEPRSEPLLRAFRHFRLQCLRTDPAPGADLLRVATDRAIAAPDVDRAQLLFTSGIVELRLILELEQKPQRAADAQLFPQPALKRRLQRFKPAGMAAAAIGPVKWPKPLR